MSDPSEKLAEYKATARERARLKQQLLAERYKRARTVARMAAATIKQQFKVERLAVFGSLVHSGRFHVRSDIDLAVWGLPEDDYYRAVGILQSVDPDFSIDLVRVEAAPSSLQAEIEQDGEAP